LLQENTEHFCVLKNIVEVSMKIVFFWDVTRRLTDAYKCLIETYCLYLWGKALN